MVAAALADLPTVGCIGHTLAGRIAKQCIIIVLFCGRESVVNVAVHAACGTLAIIFATGKRNVRVPGLQRRKHASVVRHFQGIYAPSTQ